MKPQFTFEGQSPCNLGASLNGVLRIKGCVIFGLSRCQHSHPACFELMLGGTRSLSTALLTSGCHLECLTLNHHCTNACFLRSFDDWADNTTLTRFALVTIVAPHYDLFELSRRLTIPGIADWIIWSVMLLQIIDDIALFAFVIAHLGYHGRVGSLARMLRMELFGLVLASVLWTCFDPTWFNDLCLYSAIFVR